jgi:23S rRNA (adenine2030-N6)-methyltransferase
VIDTHAGAGRYDLSAEPAQKNREFAGGIGRLWEDPAPVGAELAPYLDLVRAENPDGRLRWYPGSPCLVRALLRPGDGLVLCERHPADHPVLRAACAGDPRVAIHFRDGYEAAALVPPPQRRGLVLMDPSFEVPGEFERLGVAVQGILRRWAGAMIAIWYPIIEREPSQGFLDGLKSLGIPALLCAELGVRPYRGSVGLHGSGMLLVNPPWGLDAVLARLLSDLKTRLRVAGPGETRLEWLMPPR